MRMAKREQTTDVTEETSYDVKRMKSEPESEENNAKQYFDPIHYMGKTEYDLDEIFQEVDNGKYIFTLRSLCPGMAKTILNYKSIIFEHLRGKFNFASIQTIDRAEADPGFVSKHDPTVLPLCIQMVIQVNSRSKKEFITQALKDVGFFGKNARSPLFCSGGRGLEDICSWGCFKVRDKARDCLFDKEAHCHYLKTASSKYSYSADY